MGFIQNYDALATSEQRRVVLDLIEAAFESIQPEPVLSKKFLIQGNNLNIKDKIVDLESFERIFLLGFGKGSAKISSIIEKTLGDKLSEGFVIDVVSEKFSKINFTLGTHPLPSQVNFDFTEKILERFTNLKDTDLVLVVTCGGGSALFESPFKISLSQIVEVNKALLKSGAKISEMNVTRKHLSKVKGGGLAKVLFPSTVFNLVFSDVPGNDLATIASGPLVFDDSTVEDAWALSKKFGIDKKIFLRQESLTETPKDNKFFEKVTNIIMLSNETALTSMAQKAKGMGKKVKIFSNNFQSEARLAGKKLVDVTPADTILLVGGETTVHVSGNGEGGRNQELVLGALNYLSEGVVISSFDSDGWDNSIAAGAIGDIDTIRKANDAKIDIEKHLEDNSSLAFFKVVGDAILTGRLPTNVSDLMIVYRR